MLFNSLSYLVFLVAVCALYRLLGLRAQNAMLLVSSYFFYAWWDVRFLLLVVLSTSIAYCGALMIDRGGLSTRQRTTASLSTVAAAVLCVGVDWSAVSRAGIDWARLAPDAEAAGIVAAVVAAITLANALHGRVAGLPEPRRRKLLVTASIAINLGLLGLFKYFDFFVASAEDAVRALGFEPPSLRLGLILPVGISFYTFRTLSYTIDVYRGGLAPTTQFSELALYDAFFPQLVAGPIERAARLLPQIQRERRLSAEKTLRGLHLILLGLFKKVAIADGVALTVDQIFASHSRSWLEVILGTVLFAIQIYGDFSGYSDIARGSAKLLGIDLVTNFDLPYFARNPQEFWQRWHISLSTWLRDYLYIPLGGHRGSQVSTFRNLIVTMVLGGLWHGAAWGFLLFGLYHGVLLSVHHAWSTWRGAPGHWPLAVLPRAFRGLLARSLCLLAVGYGWLIFRAESLGQLFEFTVILVNDFGNLYLDARVAHSTVAMVPVAMGLPILIALEVHQYTCADVHADIRLASPVRGLLYASLLFTLIVGVTNKPAEFIYFAF